MVTNGTTVLTVTFWEGTQFLLKSEIGEDWCIHIYTAEAPHSSMAPTDFPIATGGEGTKFF